jgi:type III pantothenate kinase
LQLSQLLVLDGLDLTAVSGVVICCVVPPLQVALRQMASRRLTVPTVVVEAAGRTGMRVLYDNPKEVGADRIADAVAAFERYGGPTIVVDFGTATNFEVVSAKGEYLGGVLFPGIEVSLNALTARAAMLPRVDLAAPRNILGKNTVESLQSGIFYGFGAVVEGVCAKLKEEVGPATVVATGGLAPIILPATKVIDFHEPWLTLYGLRTIYHRNRPDD